MTSPSLLPSMRWLRRDECLALLRTQSLGRVAVRLGPLPAILPVNYAMLDDDVIFRSAPGTKLSAATMKVQVAFEIDAVTPSLKEGWSVLVVGHADEIRDRERLAQAATLGLQPWAPGNRDHFIRIRSEHITGRRIEHGPPGVELPES